MTSQEQPIVQHTAQGYVHMIGPADSPVTMAVTFSQLAMAQLLTHPDSLAPIWRERGAKANPYLRDTLKQMLKIAAPQLKQAIAEAPSLPALPADEPFEIAQGLTALLPADPTLMPPEPPMTLAEVVAIKRAKQLPFPKPIFDVDAWLAQHHPEFSSTQSDPPAAENDDPTQPRWLYRPFNPPPTA